MKRSALSSAISILLLLSTMLIFCVNGEVDETSTVTRVIDGDTFDISTGERIRLADVDTPESGEAGYSEAKSFMAGLIGGKTVYLDIDDVTRTDPYGRLVCVVYVDYNSTHYENVNKALLIGNYAVVYDFDNNEFSPYSWSLYLLKEAVPEPTQSPGPSITPTPTATPDSDSDLFQEDYLNFAVAIFAIIFVIVVFVMVNKTGKRRRVNQSLSLGVFVKYKTYTENCIT
jgi:endonuclease YncB( thermonuclease family)